MKLLISIFIFFASNAFATNTFFLSKFLGSHKVISRTCKPMNSICQTLSRIDLVSAGPDSFLLNGYDSSNNLLSSKELKQEFGGLISTTLGGFDSPNNGGFTGMWNLIEKDQNGVQLRSEAVYFNSDSLFENPAIKLTLTLRRKADQQGKPDFRSRQDFVLSRYL